MLVLLSDFLLNRHSFAIVCVSVKVNESLEIKGFLESIARAS